ncbi:HAMP domain-containing sensor histidine kinase [Lactovum odontotermitis]
MNRRYSITKRIYRAIAEIFIGVFLLFLFQLVFIFLLHLTGQLNYAGEPNISFGQNASVSGIRREMKTRPYDYAVFDRNTGKLLAGRYVKTDLPEFETAFKKSRSIKRGLIDFNFFENRKLVFVLRSSQIPEVTSHSLRRFSVNNFSYIFMIAGLFLLIIYSATKLIREFVRNFRAVQTMSRQMGSSEQALKPEHSKIIEFDEVLSQLYTKGEELSTLIEAERTEKKDLSFQVAALSHDVKTPLTVLKGNIELLEMTELTVQQHDFVHSMKNSIKTFDNYFGAMVNYTRLLSDDGDYRETISFEGFMDGLLIEIEDLVKTYRVDFQLKITGQIETFHGNQVSLDRALINIFVNACHYAEAGDKQVTLVISEDMGHVIFEFWNNGRPFTESALKNAGKLFFTEDTGRSGKHYGVGLSFAQAVALKHGGALLLENPEMGGAKVTLTVSA